QIEAAVPGPIRQDKFAAAASPSPSRIHSQRRIVLAVLCCLPGKQQRRSLKYFPRPPSPAAPFPPQIGHPPFPIRSSKVVGAILAGKRNLPVRVIKSAGRIRFDRKDSLRRHQLPLARHFLSLKEYQITFLIERDKIVQTIFVQVDHLNRAPPLR